MSTRTHPKNAVTRSDLIVLRISKRLLQDRNKASDPQYVYLVPKFICHLLFHIVDLSNGLGI